MALPKIISVDDHVVEPPHVWQTWLPAKWRERGPHVERKKWGSFKHLSGAKYDMVEDPDGEWGDAWYYDGELIYVQKKFVAIPKSATTLDEHGNMVFDRSVMTMTATTYDEMRKGCWDRDERVKDLTLNYTDGSLPFPTFPRFCGQTFHEGADKELGLACVKANNDWMVEEWCEPSGGVNIPLCLIPLWDAQLAAEETKRNAERGVRAIAFSEIPTRLKLPSINTDYWDPLWQVCNDYGVTVCMHVGSSSSNPVASPDSQQSRGGHSRIQQCDRLDGRLAVLGQSAQVPEVEVGLLGGPDRMDPLRSRARRHGLGEPRRVDRGKGEDPGSALHPVLRANFRLLHRRPPRPALPRGSGRGQHLLRDRLSPYGHDLAVLRGLHREAL